MSRSARQNLAVIKVGGDVLLEQRQLVGLTRNLTDLRDAGWSCVILHGGGTQVSELQRLHGLPVQRVAGRRITSAEDMLAVKQALCGQVNLDLVAALAAAGLPAFGCSGASGGIIQARKRPPVKVSGGGGEPIDFGQVGDVTDINTDLLEGLLQLGQLPVVASIGIGRGGELYNINADATATAIALALRAEALILTTAIGGVLQDPTDANSRIDVITPESATQLIGQGVISDGMIPKVEESLKLLQHGVGRVAITSGAESGSFLNVINDSSLSGTRFLSHL